MMRVILIEDEWVARQNLRKLLGNADPQIEIAAELDSVRSAVEWLQRNPHPELAFVDIQLSDDVSFRIFDAVEISFPVIFVTAFDEYLQRAFEYNSLHYLLKPVNQGKIEKALKKVREIEQHFLSTRLRDFLLQQQTPDVSQSRIIVRKGMDFIPVSFEEIAYAFTEHKISFVRDRKGETFMADENLSELAARLPSKMFFRLNRQYVAHVSAIQSFRGGENGKLEVKLTPETGSPVVVSRESAPAFRKWIGR